MPLYFFHLRAGGHLDKDVFGVDLPGLDEVRREALGAMADMVRDAELTGRAVQGEAFEIADRDGRPVLTMGFDALLGRLRVDR